MEILIKDLKTSTELVVNVYIQLGYNSKKFDVKNGGYPILIKMIRDISTLLIGLLGFEDYYKDVVHTRFVNMKPEFMYRKDTVIRCAITSDTFLPSVR